MEECHMCDGSGIFMCECCNGAGGCSCHGQPVPMECQCVSGVSIREQLEGYAFIGSGPSSGYWSGAPALNLGIKPTSKDN